MVNMVEVGCSFRRMIELLCTSIVIYYNIKKYMPGNETIGGSKKIEEQISDFLIKIEEEEVYLLKCQNYDDGSMKSG